MGWGLICTHAFATCCVSVCALQTRVLGTLCVPSSGEMRALLSFISVDILLACFSTGKSSAKILRDFWDVFRSVFGDCICCMLDSISILMHGSLRVKW